jgi:hypothetical protein
MSRPACIPMSKRHPIGSGRPRRNQAQKCSNPSTRLPVSLSLLGSRRSISLARGKTASLPAARPADVQLPPAKRQPPPRQAGSPQPAPPLLRPPLSLLPPPSVKDVTEPTNYTRLSKKIIHRADDLANLSPYNPVVREITTDFKPTYIPAKIVISSAVTITNYIKVRIANTSEFKHRCYKPVSDKSSGSI